MFILNSESITKKYECDEEMSKYLINKCGLPLLSRFNEKYYFSKTIALEKALEEFKQK